MTAKFLTIDTNDPQPLYLQIVDGIKALIAGGHLSEGSTLPSVRQVGSDLGVNFNTVAAAYRQLQEEGFLSVRHGAGAVIASGRVQVNDVALRKPLRAALTELVLAGLTDREIVRLVRGEIDALRKAGRPR